MIASDTLFDSRGWVFGVKLCDEDIADFKVLRMLPWQPFLAFYIWVHIGATWQIRLNRPCAAAMRPYVKLLWPLVIFCRNITEPDFEQVFDLLHSETKRLSIIFSGKVCDNLLWWFICNFFSFFNDDLIIYMMIMCLLGHITAQNTDGVARSVSVCLLVMTVSHAKVAELIVMLFQILTRMGPRNHVNHLSISPSHPGQLGLLPSVGQEMSTSQSAVMLCGWGVKAWLIPLVDKRVDGR